MIYFFICINGSSAADGTNNIYIYINNLGSELSTSEHIERDAYFDMNSLKGEKHIAFFLYVLYRRSVVPARRH